jgi:hybrid cluster-associated redox disulfide protein
MRLHRDLLVDDVMRRWPSTIRLFMSWRMKCVGCPFNTFHTIADACIEHAACEADFMQALETLVASDGVTLSARREQPAGADRE